MQYEACFAALKLGATSQRQTIVRCLGLDETIAVLRVVAAGAKIQGRRAETLDDLSILAPPADSPN
jgi:hypothetical protein